MNPQLLADPTATPQSEQPAQPADSGDSLNGLGPGGPDQTTTPRAPSPEPEPARTCANCGATLDDGQDWCLQCGAAAPGSLEGGGPGWRSATTVLAATTVLVLGAAAAAYAALTQPGPRTLAPRVVTIARATPPTTPPASTPAIPTTPGAVGTPTTIKPLPHTTAPKIPLTASTPEASGSTGSSESGAGTNSGSGETGTGTAKSNTKSTGGTTEQPAPILLDTNAASTYNPYGYPTSWFGDPRLAIDGETSTAWTAQVNPAVAPKMAEGLVIDLKTAQKVGSVALITSTPGMTVQVYGANGAALPPSITDSAWTGLSPSLQVKQRRTKIVLRDASKAFRYVVLWISRAPKSSVGTPSAPGRVSVNELELFAATK